MKRASSGSTHNDTQAPRYGSYQQQQPPPKATAPAAGSSLGYHPHPHPYQPPVHYAADQTATLQDTTKTYYQAEATANAVLQQMSTQRQGLQNSHANVWEMRQATEQAKRELQTLQHKYRAKKQRLYALIAVLSVTDLFLLMRILQCGGNFFC
jgi:hypothetical protein